MNLKAMVSIAVIAVQLAIPAFMLRNHLNILANGELYRFKAEPFDPYDAMRGRYMVFSVDNEVEHYDGSPEVGNGQVVFAVIGKDNEGFAVIDHVTLSRPDNAGYIKTVAYYDFLPGNKNRVALPFNRFYMNEYKTKRAQKLYFDHTKTEESGTYVTVRVLNGKTAVENLYLADKPIEKYFD